MPQNRWQRPFTEIKIKQVQNSSSFRAHWKSQMITKFVAMDKRLSGFVMDEASVKTQNTAEDSQKK